MALKSSIHQESTLKEKTAKGFFWGGISNFLQQIIGMIFGVIIARILSPDDYGLIAMLAIFTAIANTITDSGFCSALINRKTIEHKYYNAVFWFSFFIGSCVYIILFFAAPLIADFYNQPILCSLSRILFLSFLINGLGGAHHAMLVKQIKAKERGLTDIISVVCSGIIGLILALNGFAVWGLAIQQVFQSFISTALRWYYSRWRPTFQFDFSPIKEMFGYSIKLFITSIFAQITNNLFSTVFGKLYGKGLTGHYAQGNKWATYGSFVIVGTFNGIAQPVLVEAKTDLLRQLNIFRKMLRFGAFITFPALLGFAFVGKEFIFIFLGDKWMDSVIFMQLFCIWGINSYLISLYTMLIWSHEKSNIYMNIMVSLFICQLLALYFSSSAGIMFMIYVYIGLYYLSTFAFHFYANRIIGLKLKNVVKDLFPYVSASVIAIAAAWLASYYIDNIYIKFMVKVLVTVVTYISILWFSNSVILKESVQYFTQKGKIQ